MELLLGLCVAIGFWVIGFVIGRLDAKKEQSPKDRRHGNGKKSIRL